MDFDSLQDDNAAAAPAANAPASGSSATVQSPGKFDDLEDDSDKYGSMGQQLLTGLEGAARGATFGGSTFIEQGLSKLGVPGLSDQDISARQKENPIPATAGEIGGVLASSFYGVGEGALLAKAGQGAAEVLGLGNAASRWGKIGSAVIKGFTEASLFQGGDEISKGLLGQGDPEHPVGRALLNSGYAGLIGGGLGGGLGIIGQGASKTLQAFSETKMASGLAQLRDDFGNRWSWHQSAPDLAESIHNELTDFYNSTKNASDEIRGGSGLKSQAIDKLAANVDPNKVSEHVGDISKILGNAPKAMQGDPLFQDAVNKWRSVVGGVEDSTNPFAQSKPASASDVFKATDALKRQMQEWGEYNKKMVPLAEVPFRNAAKSIGFNLRTSLEDTGVWGDLGNLQADVNAATKDFIPKLKDFNSKFTTKMLGEPVIDPSKAQTYANQLGKPNAEIKQAVMQNYVESAEKYRSEINDIYGRLGLESPITPSSLNTVKGTYGDVTKGSAMADSIYKFGVPGFTTKIADKIGGADIGYKVGGVGGAIAGFGIGTVLPYLQEAAGRKIKDYAVPAILNALGHEAPEAAGAALEHADSIVKGNALLKKAIDGVFSGGKAARLEISSKNKDKIRDFVEGGGVTQQTQNQLQMSQPAQMAPVQNFAEGGMVKAYKPPPPPNPNAPPDRLGSVYPAQNMLMTAAKGRVYDYLNNMRPKDDPPAAPFDVKVKNTAAEKKYDKALDIAASPVSVLHHIQNGTLDIEHMQHMKQMWPEVYNQMAKSLTQRISEEQIKGQKPSYKVRQSMSLFLGAPLDSSMKPENIMAAQNVFMRQNQQKSQAGQPAKAKKGSSSALTKVSENYRTPNQSAESRQAKG